jgi:hypothetical protein
MCIFDLYILLAEYKEMWFVVDQEVVILLTRGIQERQSAQNFAFDSAGSIDNQESGQHRD